MSYELIQLFKDSGKIFMPTTTPRQKISQVKLFGGRYVEVILTGDTFDDSFAEAKKFCNENKMTFIHPFDDPKVIAGQGTVGVEIMNDMQENVDYVITPIGGGGLVSGIGAYIKSVSPMTKIIGVEPAGAASMTLSLKQNKVVALKNIDKFVDGAAVKQVGQLQWIFAKK